MIPFQDRAIRLEDIKSVVLTAGKIVNRLRIPMTFLNFLISPGDIMRGFCQDILGFLPLCLHLNPQRKDIIESKNQKHSPEKPALESF